MDFRILEFIVFLAFVQWTGGLPLSCLYNGTLHEEGETVRTDEPCLSCVCQKGTLECSLRVCADYPNVLPPGCFLLHKPNHCCLQIICGQNYNPTGVELRTSFKSENKFHENDCIINGSIYGEGSAVASSQPCEYCYCVEGEIKCIRPRCSHPFETCKAIYETSSCCPTHYDCRESNVSVLISKMKNFVSGDMNDTVSNYSLRSYLNLDLEPEKKHFNLNENVYMDLSKTERKQIEELTTTETEKRKNEKNTVTPVQESTMTSIENSLTTLSTKPEMVILAENSTLKIKANRNDSSPVKDIEDAPEIQMQRTSDTVLKIPGFKKIGSFMESQKESRHNASQEIADYDNYDYNEPHLPPSLPNLVIFPFVAADAVVKSESTQEFDSSDKDQLGKTDLHRVFYEDYFFPPIKSEGGFVPNKPSNAEESFYEHVHLGKEQIELPTGDAKENTMQAAQAQRSNEINLPSFADNRNTNATLANRLDSVLNVTVDPLFTDMTPSDFETPPGFLLRADNETTFIENSQTKKPVTVTFKNLVVDFYPNYLITTSKKVQFETETQTSVEKSFITQKPQGAVIPLNTNNDPPFSFYEEPSISASSEVKQESSVIIPSNSTGRETLLFNKFIHSFLTEATSTTTMMSTSKKHKFSSKIKNQLITTRKPGAEKFSQKTELKINTANLSTESHSILSEGLAASFSVGDKPKNHDEKRKVVKTGEITRFIETVKPTGMKNEKKESSESFSEDFSSVNRKPDLAATAVEGNCLTPNVGALLKLAGCNIYGMMYRVGKIVTELSGPCTECMCTDLGVQCKPLKC